MATASTAAVLFDYAQPMTHESGYSSGPSPSAHPGSSDSEEDDEQPEQVRERFNYSSKDDQNKNDAEIGMPELIEFRPKISDSMAQHLMGDNNADTNQGGNGQMEVDEGIEEIPRGDDTESVSGLYPRSGSICLHFRLFTFTGPRLAAGDAADLGGEGVRV